MRARLDTYTSYSIGCAGVWGGWRMAASIQVPSSSRATSHSGSSRPLSTQTTRTAADYDWDPTDEDEEGKGGWRCVSTYHDVPPVDVSVPADIVVGDPADRTLNNHFGPSAMNSASRPAARNHSTIAICVGFSVP